MNYVLLIFSFLKLMVAPQDVNLDKGLVAYYSFDRCDARDDTGFGSDGSMYGNIACWCGVSDDGLLFDGVDDYVTFSGRVNKVFSTTDFSVSYYFKPSTRAVFKQSMLSKRADCDEYALLETLWDHKALTIETSIQEAEHIYYPELSPVVLQDKWNHFVLVRRGTQAFTYLNGALQRKSFRCSGVDISNDAPLSFSDSPCIGLGTRRFKGVLDELKVYDRALSDAEVLALYLLHPIEHAEQDCFSFDDKKINNHSPEPALYITFAAH